jgi:hypothetical protein
MKCGSCTEYWELHWELYWNPGRAQSAEERAAGNGQAGVSRRPCRGLPKEGNGKARSEGPEQSVEGKSQS